MPGSTRTRSLLTEWGLADDVSGLETFALTVAEAVGPVASVVKPQSAFYERFGSRGIAVLERVVTTCREAGALVLLDVKRGDIGSTSQAYADAYLDPASPIAVDAITVSPYLGFGSLDPFVESARRHDAGLFVLALTSNKEGPEVQHATTRDGRAVGGRMLDHLRGLNDGAEPLGSFGAVVGATIGDVGESFDINGPILAPGLRRPGRDPGRPPPDLRRRRRHTCWPARRASCCGSVPTGTPSPTAYDVPTTSSPGWPDEAAGRPAGDRPAARRLRLGPGALLRGRRGEPDRAERDRRPGWAGGTARRARHLPRACGTRRRATSPTSGTR